MGEYMPLSKFIKVSALGLFILVGASSIPVFADGERFVSEYKRKPCGYDRNSSDAEKTSGDCTGTVPTPEPVTILLFSAGLAGVGFAARRRLRRED